MDICTYKICICTSFICAQLSSYCLSRLQNCLTFNQTSNQRMALVTSKNNWKYFRNSGGHMMMMYFHGGFDEVILFDFWRINSVGGLVGSMAIIFIMGVCYEGLKALRDALYRKESPVISSQFLGFLRGALKNFSHHVYHLFSVCLLNGNITGSIALSASTLTPQRPQPGTRTATRRPTMPRRIGRGAAT